MTRLAIFDLDGTLVDSVEDLWLAVNHALATLGLPGRTLEEVKGFVGEGATRLLERAVAPHQHLLEPALDAWRAHYRAHLLDHTALYPGVGAALASARCALAVHTNKPGAMARRILEGLGVAERFASIVGGDDAPRKPDPAGTLEIMARVGARAEETVFIGDSRVDLETARAAGVRFVAVTWGLVPAPALAQAGATDLAHDAAGLLPWLGAAPPAAASTAPAADASIGRMGVDERVHEAFDRGDFDGAATEALRGYGPEIRGYLLAMIRDEEDASDVFSQFAEDAWKGMRQFRWECSLRPWLYRVAYHAAARFARDQYRQRRRRFETTMASKIADEVRMSSVVRLDRRQQQIQKLRESLDPDERTLLILRIDRGLSWKDVSHVISEQGGAPIEEAALRKRFERVRDKLAQRAKEEGLLD